ncbi:MAG: hypothetical protein IPI93_08880 [Sphingobacteriaceae bacterium]|nr:hypothetical protein [Sphingobacteriaceae bacterium]
MRPFKIIFTLFLFTIASLSYSQKYMDGDIIFIKNKKVGASLIPNGKTKFNYLGVIFIENGVPMVYHATEPVSSSNVDDFINLSEGREYKIRRLYEQELLDKDVVSTMRSFAKAKLQMHYDSKLTLNNDELYNAEFVYKMFQQCLGIPLAKPKTLDSYKNEAASIEFLKDAYGPAILTEKMVVTGDIYNSEYVTAPETE